MTEFDDAESANDMKMLKFVISNKRISENKQNKMLRLSSKHSGKAPFGKAPSSKRQWRPLEEAIRGRNVTQQAS